MDFYYDTTVSNDKMTILCLDDDIIDLRCVGAMLLQKFDINLICSTSSNESLKCLEENNIDLLVQDIIRPDIMGITFIKILRTMDQFKKLPCLIMSSCALDKKLLDQIKDVNAKLRVPLITLYHPTGGFLKRNLV